MGLLERLRTATASLVDRAGDPASRVDQLIADLTAHVKAATEELIRFRAEDKRMTQRSGQLAALALEWHQRAEKAVLAGDDELAKRALLEERRLSEEHAQLRRDQRELEAITAEMLKERRVLSQRLESLKLRRGTLAQNLAADTSAVAAKGPAWDALERADKIIGEDAALAELEAELGDPLAAGDRQVDAALEKKLAETQADQALAELKRRSGV